MASGIVVIKNLVSAFALHACLCLPTYFEIIREARTPPVQQTVESVDELLLRARYLEIILLYQLTLNGVVCEFSISLHSHLP